MRSGTSVPLRYFQQFLPLHSRRTRILARRDHVHSRYFLDYALSEMVRGSGVLISGHFENNLVQESEYSVDFEHTLQMQTNPTLWLLSASPVSQLRGGVYRSFHDRGHCSLILVLLSGALCYEERHTPVAIGLE
ncbi:hypothetical protein CPSG_03933 [Coccidioides posadasii str. Silveira]|uniref:Uncharacterized protein n=1 Tax=Coccidioides posadasii (strain RMSCC 757 / Silveira) TaxID=443226 RepID=E9D2Y6_COCPS|nr:hypothetical protein CPSG_03933 [Coccidioides posadasii str. Silveira]